MHASDSTACAKGMISLHRNIYFSTPPFEQAIAAHPPPLFWRLVTPCSWKGDSTHRIVELRLRVQQHRVCYGLGVAPQVPPTLKHGWRDRPPRQQSPLLFPAKLLRDSSLRRLAASTRTASPRKIGSIDG